MEKARGLFAVEISFLATLAVWAYTRLYLYPVRVVWYGALYGSREVVTAPGAKVCMHMYKYIFMYIYIHKYTYMYI